MANIKINDVGPITEFEYELGAPGLHILRGKQGSGKTTILRTVQLAVDGRTDVKPTKRDGTARGEAKIAGRTIRIAKQIREEDDLTVEGLGDLDIAALHTPKFMDASTRDRHRIKVLVRLAGVTANASLFHKLAGDKAKYDSVVNANATLTDDLVEMAARVKREFEKAAQAREAQETSALSNMRAQQALTEGIDLNSPSDAAMLQDYLNDCLQARSRLIQQRDSAKQIMAKAAESRKKIDNQPRGLDLASARDVLKSAQETAATMDAEVERLESLLDAAKDKAKSAHLEVSAAENNLANAAQCENITAAWNADIVAAESIGCPAEAEIARAEKDIQEANAAVTLGVKVREAIKASDQISEYAESAKQHGKAARMLRDAAKDTQDVLSEAIAKLSNCPLKVKIDDSGDARIVVATDRSAAEPFDELSDGERWPYIVRIAAGHNRLIVLPQAAFGELSPDTRKQLHKLAIEHECYLLTAQSDDGDLRAEIYANGKAMAHA